MTTKYSKEEIAKHCTNGDCWLIIEGKVYDVSSYMEDHPGGYDIMLENAGGKDATDEYGYADHSKRAKSMLADYYIGQVEE